ncbi:MAG: DUF2892 domain-containing protein [Kangiellaceae bacterium]
MNLPKVNLSSLDRWLRGIVSLVFFVYSFLYYEDIGDMLLLWAIWVFGALNLISFVIGWCPVYQLANITTCKSKS